ncbi:MAG: CotH kinase family protein [Acidimicrobiia bacterium]
MTSRSRHLAWRRNWWLIAALSSFTAGMLVLMGTEKVVPYTTSKSLAAQTKVDGAAKAKTITAARGLPGKNINNTVDAFDHSIVHRVSISMSTTAYDAMILDYQVDGVKTWHVATVVIDGVRIKNVGVRLKGNSTLIGLRNSGPNPAGGIAASLGTLSPDEPQKMPFLLRFDEFVAGQRYQGVNELALRTSGGFGGDASQLTEYVANVLTEETGQPFLRTTTTGMTFNGSPEGFYLLVEHPDDYWARRMIPGTQPAVYKAIVGASFHYVGAEPALYVNVFNQQAETLDLGPGPMIEFLRFVEESTDREFEAHLADRLDVEQFARYLAFHNILVDPDSLAGTGNNYYLLYDPKLRRMTFAAWDQNLAFGRLGFGGGPYRPYYEDGSGLGSLAGNIPGLEELIPGSALGEPNILVTRFLASPKFRAVYNEAYRELFKSMLKAGRATALLDELGTVIRKANEERNLVDPARFESDLERNHSFIADRVEYLLTLPPVGG